MFFNKTVVFNNKATIINILKYTHIPIDIRLYIYTHIPCYQCFDYLLPKQTPPQPTTHNLTCIHHSCQCQGYYELYYRHTNSRFTNRHFSSRYILKKTEILLGRKIISPSTSTTIFKNLEFFIRLSGNAGNVDPSVDFFEL